MAKANKQALTPEECLKHALVPENEQPYTVPRNWVWTRLGCINTYQGKSVDPSNNPDGMFELYSVPSCESDFPEIVTGTDIGSTKQSVNKDDVLLCKINPRINRAWIVSQHTDNPLIASSEWIIVRNTSIYGRYLMWCFQSHSFREYMLSNVSGVGGSLMRAQPKFVEGYPVPLPPLAEQRRIVKRIESLFEKLDRAKELAQAALDSFETRKAAILHKALTGELIGLTQVSQCPLAELTEEIRIGPFGTMLHAEDYIISGVPVINPKHINNQSIEPQHSVTISKEKASELEPYTLKTNDIILGRRGEMGRTAPISEIEEGWICGTGSMIIRLKNNYLAPFYSRILSSKATVEYLEQNAVGSTMKNLNERIVSSIPVPLFSLGEQKGMIQILDSLLEKEQRARELCDVINKIDLMKKAILARAFCGELGTNDPSEESAVGLLRAII